MFSIHEGGLNYSMYKQGFCSFVGLGRWYLAHQHLPYCCTKRRFVTFFSSDFLTARRLVNQLYNVKRVPVNAPLCNRVEESICTECPLHMLNSVS